MHILLVSFARDIWDFESLKPLSEVIVCDKSNLIVCDKWVGVERLDEMVYSGCKGAVQDGSSGAVWGYPPSHPQLGEKGRSKKMEQE